MPNCLKAGPTSLESKTLSCLKRMREDRRRGWGSPLEDMKALGILNKKFQRPKPPLINNSFPTKRRHTKNSCSVKVCGIYALYQTFFHLSTEQLQKQRTFLLLSDPLHFQFLEWALLPPAASKTLTATRRTRQIPASAWETRSGYPP